MVIQGLAKEGKVLGAQAQGSEFNLHHPCAKARHGGAHWKSQRWVKQRQKGLQAQQETLSQATKWAVPAWGMTSEVASGACTYAHRHGPAPKYLCVRHYTHLCWIGFNDLQTFLLVRIWRENSGHKWKIFPKCCKTGPQLFQPREYLLHVAAVGTSSRMPLNPCPERAEVYQSDLNEDYHFNNVPFC